MVIVEIGRAQYAMKTIIHHFYKSTTMNSTECIETSDTFVGPTEMSNLF